MNLVCFFGPPRTTLTNDEFEKFAADYCGPNQPVLCGDNPHFLRNLGLLYDDMVPPGTKGARKINTGNFSTSDVTQVNPSEKIRINGIEVNNFLPTDLSKRDYISILSTNSYLFGYASNDSKFYVDVKKGPFGETLRSAQSAIMETLDVSKNEACYLGIYGTGSETVLPEGIGYYSDLPFCEGPARADIVPDGFVNTADIAECIDEYEFTEEDLLCDLDVSRKVNALDLSLMLPHIGEIVPEAYK